MSGTKTQEHRKLQLQHGEDSQNWGPGGERQAESAGHQAGHSEARQTANPRGISQQGMNQESRDHHKHNNPGQSGHGPQTHHSPDQEKQTGS